MTHPRFHNVVNLYEWRGLGLRVGRSSSPHNGNAFHLFPEDINCTHLWVILQHKRTAIMVFLKHDTQMTLIVLFLVRCDGDHINTPKCILIHIMCSIDTNNSSHLTACQSHCHDIFHFFFLYFALFPVSSHWMQIDELIHLTRQQMLTYTSRW